MMKEQQDKHRSSAMLIIFYPPTLIKNHLHVRNRLFLANFSALFISFAKESFGKYSDAGLRDGFLSKNS